ncbi:MAG: hypothetical protein II984_11480 [Clostridia bacterium]|nr:hypothetical protein [Clostridia bacterium]
MKKKYTPAELEIIMASICDVITTSAVVPPDPEEPGEGGGTGESGTGSSGSGTGGTYNPDGWMGI